MKSIILFLLSLLTATSLHAQELWGASNSNYAGVMGHDLNPASVTGAPFRWELHLLSLDASLMNNYMYLQRNSHAIRRGVRGDAVEDDRFTDKFTTSDKSGFASAFLKFPALMYSTPKWGLSFHVSSRMALSVNDVPYHLAKFMKEGFDYTPLQQMDFTGNGSKLAVASWHEAGITAGKALIDVQGSYLTAGITLNYLFGLNSLYMNINDIQYNVRTDTLWQIYMADVQFAHAAPGADGGFNDYMQKRGSGFSGSIGFQYYRNRNESAYDPCASDRKQKKYDYKIGVSLLDAGRINFNRQAYFYDFENVGTDWYGIDTVDFNNLNEADFIFNNQFYGFPFAALQNREFAMWMPAALSLQIDYAYSPNIYFNVSAIQNVKLSDQQIQRPDQIAVTARYETKMWEVAIPYSYYDYFRHRLGIALRYGIFTVGTDMIGPFTGLFDSYGIDFYAGIKLQHNPACGKKNGKAGKFKKKNDCFDDF